MIAPDIIIRQFVDSKVNVEKMMEEAGMAPLSADMMSSLSEEPEKPLLDEINYQENEIQDNDELFSRQKLADNRLESTTEPESELKVYSGRKPCRMKYGIIIINYEHY